jgi:uncharacterized protein YdaU (DUF1376 family)
MSNKIKSKDPAFLFYVNDFDSGTKFFTHEQVGKFIRLLMAQFNHGSLSEKQVIFICGTLDEDIMNKFAKDENGNYFNIRLSDEIEKRKKYSESRSNNKKGKNKEHMSNISISYDSTHDNHIENENENEIDYVNVNELSIYPFSENFMQHWDEWKAYRFQQHKFKYKSPSSEQSAFNLLVKKANQNESLAIDILNYTMAHGWKMFVLPKTDKNEPANRDQARIDYWNHMVDTFGTDEEKATRKIV